MKQKHQTNRLREIRMNLGLTQKQVALQLGLQCEDRISHWERGHSMPSAVNLLRLCAIYNIAPKEVYEIIMPAADDSSNILS